MHPISIETLSRIKKIITEHDRCKNFLSLARKEVIDALRAVEAESGRSLIPLAAFNRVRDSHHFAARDGAAGKNGIACPDCGAELVDVDPSTIQLLYPPLTKVHCDNCGFSGHRTA